MKKQQDILNDEMPFPFCRGIFLLVDNISFKIHYSFFLMAPVLVGGILHF
jgi:hypothetical protein